MRTYKFTAILLGAAICAFSFSGCAQRSEVPLESYVLSAAPKTQSSEAISTSPSAEPGASTSGTTSSSSSAATSTSSNAATSSSSSAAASTSSSAAESSSTTSSSEPTSSSTSTHTHLYEPKKVEPTCAEPGYTVHTCSCGDQYTTDTVEALGHDLTSEVIKPTCTSGGYTQYTCKRCGYKYKDDFTSASEHKYKKQVVKATCSTDGYTLYTCEVCGKEYTENRTMKLEHEWGEWTVTKQATVSSDGEQQRKCSRCDKTETKTIPRIEDFSAYADEVIRLVNVERAKQGLSALSKRDDISEYAQLRATELVTSFSHTRPNGSDPLSYVMDLPGVWGAGENIAMGYGSPESVMTGWMNSPGHRDNILSKKIDYNSIGVGCYKSGGQLYWVQIFVK